MHGSSDTAITIGSRLEHALGLAASALALLVMAWPGETGGFALARLVVALG